MLGTLFPLINLFIITLKCIDNEYTKKTSLETYLYHVGSFQYIVVDSNFFFRKLFFIFKSSLWWTFRVMLSDGVSYFKIRV